MKLLSGWLALGVVSIVSAFALYEVVLRLFFPPPQLADIRRLRAPEPGSMIHEKQKVSLYVTTPTGRRMRPNTRAVVSNHQTSKKVVVVETNSLGYRNRDLGPKQKPQRLPVLTDDHAVSSA